MSNNFTDKTSQQLHISAFQLNAANSDLNRLSGSIKLDDSNDPSDRASNETQSSKHTYDLPYNDSASLFTINENIRSSFQKRASVIEDGFQGDAPAFGGRETAGKIYVSKSLSSFQIRDMRLALPMVRCSEEVMTITMAGREYTRISVDRVDADPLPLFQVPAYCGFSVRVTWKDLVLMAPYDGCFITKENDNYVLSLLWWDSPIKITCPMAPVTSNPTPSVFCSEFGMAIAIKGAQQAAEKHRVKVKGKILPLLSETCAYRLPSPPEVVLLYIQFNTGCVTVMGNEINLVIIVDGKQFTLSCPFPHYWSRFGPYLHSPYYQPLQPSQIPSTYEYQKPPGLFHLMFPHHHHHHHHRHRHYPAPPVDALPKFSIKPYLPPPVEQMPQMFQYPVLPPLYLEPSIDLQPTTPPVTSFLPPTYNPPTRSVMQEKVFPQMPIFPPAPPAKPSKTSPSLHCTRDRLIVTLASATIDSIKVKDVETKEWISISSVSAACNYNLRSVGDNVVLSSPLPSCHTTQKSSTVISLFIRYWHSSQNRHRTVHLQCRHSRGAGRRTTIPPLPVNPLNQIIEHTVEVPSETYPHFKVLCSSQHMSVKLPPGSTSGIFVKAITSEISTEATSILEAPSHCGYSVKMDDDGAIKIHLPYTSCHMTQMDGQYKIIFKYQTLRGRMVESLLSCQAFLNQECNIAPELWLVCGSGLLSSAECQNRGCCYSVDTETCYYPMDECTMDRHFVFSVQSTAMDPPVSPTTLVTAGNSPCGPERVTDDLALFKIPLDECGVHRYEVGKIVIYMVEILNRVQSLSLNYGTITRDSPVRLVVECRYLPGSVVSVGYLVKSPSLGPSIKAQGVFGVQLRIAKDEHYKNFYPQYHQPLQMLLGKPLYLEVRLLNPPDPTAVLLVHYCVAYPRSAKSAWILIYDGCPNILDQTPTYQPTALAEALTNHVKRFTVTTFQFLSEDTNVEADEEIYFMCSTEVCLPSEGPCVEGCFADPSSMTS